jgi:hypothetical protein
MKPGATYTGQAPQLPNQSNPTANFAPSAGDSWDTSDSQGISIIRPKKPSGSSASPTPTASAVLPTGTTGTSDVDAFTSKWDKLLADSTKDADKQKELAGWTALANFGLGWAGGSAVDAQGHPVSALQNAAKAGLPALQGYTQSLAQERQQQQENLMQRMGLGIKGIQLGQSDQEVALKRQQLAQELPLQQAQAQSYLAHAKYLGQMGNMKGPMGGQVTGTDYINLLKIGEGYKQDPLNSPLLPYLQQNDPAAVKSLQNKVDPTTPSGMSAAAAVDRAVNSWRQDQENEISMRNRKTLNSTANMGIGGY